MTLETHGYSVSQTTIQDKLQQDRLVLPSEITRNVTLLSNSLIALLSVPFKGNQKARLLAAIEHIEAHCKCIKELIK